LIIDASVWVSFIVTSEPDHAMVYNWFMIQLAPTSLIIEPQLVLPEVGGAINRRLGAIKANNAITMIKTLPNLQLYDLDSARSSLAADLAIKLGLRGPDSIYVALAYELNVPLITLDKEIDTKAGKTITVQMP
jgi:predicted nucleic acid-binding protein